MPETRARLAIPADHDGETIASAVVEIDSFLDYEEEQSGRLDDRTREAFVLALEVMTDVRDAYSNG